MDNPMAYVYDETFCNTKLKFRRFGVKVTVFAKTCRPYLSTPKKKNAAVCYLPPGLCVFLRALTLLHEYRAPAPIFKEWGPASAPFFVVRFVGVRATSGSRAKPSVRSRVFRRFPCNIFDVTAVYQNILHDFCLLVFLLTDFFLLLCRRCCSVLSVEMLRLVLLHWCSCWCYS